MTRPRSLRANTEIQYLMIIRILSNQMLWKFILPCLTITRFQPRILESAQKEITILQKFLQLTIPSQLTIIVMTIYNGKIAVTHGKIP